MGEIQNSINGIVNTAIGASIARSVKNTEAMQKEITKEAQRNKDKYSELSEKTYGRALDEASNIGGNAVNKLNSYIDKNDSINKFTNQAYREMEATEALEAEAAGMKKSEYQLLSKDVRNEIRKSNPKVKEIYDKGIDRKKRNFNNFFEELRSSYDPEKIDYTERRLQKQRETSKKQREIMQRKKDLKEAGFDYDSALLNPYIKEQLKNYVKTGEVTKEDNDNGR